MRIGFDGTPLLGPRSGVGYYTSRLIGSLTEAQPDWEYMLYSNRPLNGLEAPLDRLPQVGSPFTPSRWLWMQTILPWTIRQSCPHICHFPNSLAPLWQPRPFVLTIHDASLYLYRGYHPWSRHLAIRMLLPLAAKRASAIVTVSEHARQDLIKIMGLPPEKLHVVHEAAPDYFRPETNREKLEIIRKKYKLPDRFLLYVGTIEPRKNLKRLLRALRRVHDSGDLIPLVMVGPRGWMMNDFEALVKDLTLQNKVSYLGYVPTDDLPVLYSLATIFVFPSLYEGFGLPPLEAMACGTPVLSSNRSSMVEICGDAAMLIDPESENEIAEGIRFLLANETERLAFREQGIVRSRQFSWNIAAGQTIEVYKKVLQL